MAGYVAHDKGSMLLPSIAGTQEFRLIEPEEGHK